jgi:hypothetical protein
MHYSTYIFLSIVFKIYLIHDLKHNLKLNNLNFREKQEIDFEYIKKKYQFVLDKIPLYNHTHEYSNKIFWCWLQGEENAPELYRTNLKALKNNCKSHNIIIITEKNMNQYITFPSFILQKKNDKYFSNTHFSDMLRLELLIKYGGTWIDASVLITEYDDSFFNQDLFFFKSRDEYWVYGSSWFITSEKRSPILKTTLDLLYEYWKNNNQIYNYFLFHFFFKMACDKYYQDYLKVPFYSNIPVHVLQYEIKDVFREKRYKQILDCSKIHKLTSRSDMNFANDSFYSHIIKEYS